MWATKSSRNILIAECTDDGIDGPSTQIVVCWGGQVSPGAMLSQRSSSRSMSSMRPPPCSMRYIARSIQPEPSRHGVHCPHDSREKNLVMRHAARTTQLVSSMTTIDPEPSIEP